MRVMLVTTNMTDNDNERNADKGGKTIYKEISADSDGFVREYAWKTGPKRILSEMGWYRIPVTFYNDSIFKDFREYYENRGKKKRISGNNINNMKRLLYRMGNGQATFNYKIVDYKHFKGVVTELGENKINFQTCCNYYKSLKHFNRFLKHHNQR